METHEGQDDILTTGEAASLCGVSRSTLRRAVAQGQLVAWHTPGKHLRFTRRACEDFARSLGRIDVIGRAHESVIAAPVSAKAAASHAPAVHASV